MAQYPGPEARACARIGAIHSHFIVSKIMRECEVMQMDEIMQMIGTVGFPIVMSLLLFWYVKDSTDKTQATLMQIQTEHKDEVMKMTEALNKNTITIQRLIDKLDGVSNESQ